MNVKAKTRAQIFWPPGPLPFPVSFYYLLMVYFSQLVCRLLNTVTCSICSLYLGNSERYLACGGFFVNADFFSQLTLVGTEQIFQVWGIGLV